jgi:hypothetical protein
MRKRRGKQMGRWARMGRAYQVRGTFCDGACRQLVPPVNGRAHDVKLSCEIPTALFCRGMEKASQFLVVEKRIRPVW